MTKYKCSKPCSQRKTCTHSRIHFKTADCATGCDNGAECVVVQEHETSEILQDCAPDAIKAITDERGSDYGHPIDDFNCCIEMYETWLARYRDAISKGATPLSVREENGVKESVHDICMKLARAAQSPSKKDHWDDVQGYARCAKMVLGLEQ